MNPQNLSQNLKTLRRAHRLTLEEVAERIGVSRQAAAKWENGETAPDIANCAALAELYGVTLDDLVRHDEAATGTVVPPKGKYMFGLVTVGERGQIVIPKKAREVFGICPGDSLLVLGDESADNQGLALIDPKIFFARQEQYRRALERRERQE